MARSRLCALAVVELMRNIHKFALIVLALLAVGGGAAAYKLYSALNNTILESRQVLFFKVEEASKTHPTKLIISGLAGTSAMSVSKITTKTEGLAITVMVHVALAKPGTSGSFKL